MTQNDLFQKSSLYYQINEAVLRKHAGHRYLVKHDVQFKLSPAGYEVPTVDTNPITLMFHADIVWREMDGVVSFHKNRYKGNDAELTEQDLKEFMWAKLAAVDYRNSPSVRRF